VRRSDLGVRLRRSTQHPLRGEPARYDRAGGAGARAPQHHDAVHADFTVTAGEQSGFSRRFAGRVENGRDSFSDPALGGPATGDQD